MKLPDKTYAAIDIGSNAVRLLIKRVDTDAPSPENALRKELLVRVPLRLGFDVFSRGKVSSKKAGNLIRLMKAYRQLIKIYNADELRACATSAMRDAANGQELIRKIDSETGIKIEIIAGEEEAAIVYNNHLECTGDLHGNYLYVDVGGGSTELNFLTGGELKASGSFNIGTVRILSDKVKASEWERLNTFLDTLKASCATGINIIGSGGNINKLYKMASEKDAEAKTFPVSELSRLYHQMEPLSVEQRITRFNLKPDRADVIIPASEIFLHIAAVIGASYIMVPVIGVADGIIDGMFARDLRAD